MKSAGWWESLENVPTLSQKSFIWPLGSLSYMSLVIKWQSGRQLSGDSLQK